MPDIRLTVAAIIERDQRFLIVEEIDNGLTVYNQPAGHVELNESILTAVSREVLEETGLNFQPTALVGNYLLSPATNGKHYFRFCFCGDVLGDDELKPQDPDIIKAHWMTLDEITGLGRQLRSGLVLSCLRDYLSGKRYSIDQFNFSNDEVALANSCYTALLDFK
ncbi:NUDIX hydrolase [Pleionea litopenaei]|uniref:Phosphatase NudJ n=1 Tax=Pleionea litopenaei TaxID=3070815 RepID=A0AA51X7N8_9GAMM|nr:NUDIX hydrolase [Pleionea sp. HL-JVS1]WMS88104.1 NUDIX hydrolase [Pleionea sp. HL-JVS1]